MDSTVAGAMGAAAVAVLNEVRAELRARAARRERAAFAYELTRSLAGKRPAQEDMSAEMERWDRRGY